MVKKIALVFLVICSLVVSCVSVPRTSPEEAAILERSRKDLAAGNYEWVLHDMESYLDDHPRGQLSAEAHILLGDAAKGQVDTAREEKKITGILLNTYTAPLMRKAYENYIAAADKALDSLIASEALYKAAFMLDIDYMRNFERALVLYGNVVSKYEGTVWAERSRKRYDNLAEKFRNTKGGPHNVTGE